MQWPCELYIAPSTIPNAGLGVFTGKTLRAGDTIGSTGDVAIPLIDWVWKNAQADGKYFPDPFGDYVWNGHYMGMGREVTAQESITTLWPGLDAAINSYPPLINVHPSIPNYDPDINGTMHRSKDPAMGSFSPYFGGFSVVSNDIPEGGELFKDYGKSWFLDRKMKFPLVNDMFQAEQFLGQFSEEVPLEAKPLVYQLLLDLQEIWANSKVLHAIPHSWETAQSVIHNPNPKVIKKRLREWYQPNATRSLQWLEENGVCLDSIRTAPSSLKGAGRGAFATRAFEVGDIITTSPLIHVLNKTMLERRGKSGRPDPLGGQLLMNYCYSHPEIALALCPYGKGINSINHAPAPDKVNIRLEWPSDQFLNHNATLLNLPPRLWSTRKPQLSLHYVATKPIRAGDELYLDYGPEWQRAWEDHIVAWRLSDASFLVPHGRDYVSAVEWTRRHGDSDVLWTTEEIAKNASRRVPPFLQLRCHSGILDLASSKHDPSIYDELRWEATLKNTAEGPEYGLPCRVIKRTKHGNRYTYDVMIKEKEDRGSTNVKEMKRLSVPRFALKWFDVPHSTDIHSKPLFRHSLGLPDKLVPKEWRVIAPVQEASDEQSCPGSSRPEPDEDGSLDENPTCGVNNVPASINGAKSFHNSRHAMESQECGVYLASSSIPGAGLGLFAGKPYFVGDHVGPSDIAIPIHPSWISDEESDRYEFFENPFDDYVWENAYLGFGINKESYDSTGVLWPGVNALVNCYPILTNLRLILPDYDTGTVHRFRHPGAGAFSPYRNGGAQATRYIPAGGELFENYGANYLQSRESFETVPTTRAVRTARTVLESFFNLSLDKFRHYKVYDVMKDVASLWNPRVGNVLPTMFEDAEAAMEFHQGDLGRLHQQNRTRDLSWLREHGRCMDTIVPKKSTLEGAGMGAFAKSFYPKGTILTSSPVLRVRRHWLERRVYGPDGEVETGLDLLGNYCFGAPSSSLLLCPYSSGINDINHNRSLANVRVQWAQHGDLVQDDSTFGVPPWHVDYLKQKAVLVFDYVATKDIEEDEEIFLDYGDAFEEAWNRHVREWTPMPRWESYMSAKDFNEHMMDEGRLRTEEEQYSKPYPTNLDLRCHSSLARKSMDELRNATDNGDVEFVWRDAKKILVDYGKPCEVLKRVPHEGGFLYDILIVVSGTFEKGTVEERTEVPLEAFRFFDRPYTKDFHLKKAFRHSIGLPDDMLPSAWRDIEVQVMPIYRGE